MTNETRGQRGFGNGFSITLDTTLNKCNLTAVATVLFMKKHVPRDRQNVIFSLIGFDYIPETTDEYGRATMPPEVLPGPGTYRLVAFLESEPGTMAIKTIVIEEPKKESAKADKISVRVVGKCGEQKIFVYTLDKGGGLVAKATGILLDGDKPTIFTTDKNGMYVYSANFSGERTFRVRIGENDSSNNQRAWRDVLQGR